MTDINLMTVQCPDKQMLEQLLFKGDIQSAFLACSNRYGADISDGRIFEFDWNIGLQNRYDKIIDLASLPSLDKKLMEAFREYEGMAIKLGGRKTNFEIADYDREKRNIINHLRFWNYIFKEHRINAVYFVYRPHHQMEYVIYALAKIYKIPVIISFFCVIPGVYVYGDGNDTIGEHIGTDYKATKNSEPSGLSETVDKYWKSITKEDSLIKEKLKKDSFEIKMYEETKDFFFGKYIGINSFCNRIRLLLKYALSYTFVRDKMHIIVDKKDLKIDKEERTRINFFLKHYATSLNVYNKKAEYPDFSKKYIYYALQLTPEETTIPAAGVFAEQYTSLLILSRAAQKTGVLIYVKEHYVQTFRHSEIYEMLFSLPNVRMIKSSVNSLDIISNSLAVATQTGTCILEGAVRGKPSLVFGKGYFWKEFPNLYEIESEEQCEKVINSILMTKIKPTVLDDVRRYFCSIDRSAIVVPQGYDKCQEDDYLRNKYVELLSKWIKNGFDSSYIEM